MNSCPNCAKNKKQARDDELVKNLKRRLNRAVGQLNGVNNMVDENRYCVDILTQIAAIESALKEIGYLILEDHMKTCVSDDIKNGDFSSLEEALALSKKLV